MPHVFISYVREDEAVVQRLAADLAARGVETWLDRDRLKPGTRWQHAIRQAIEEGAFFLACFSERSSARDRSYMNEELAIAIDELRRRPRDRAWFLPVALTPGSVPRHVIGSGESLHDIQYVQLYSEWDLGVERLVEVITSTGTLQRGAETRSNAEAAAGRGRPVGEPPATGSPPEPDDDGTLSSATRTRWPGLRRYGRRPRVAAILVLLLVVAAVLARWQLGIGRGAARAGSPHLWATVNACGPSDPPRPIARDTFGIRASMPGFQDSRAVMYMRFRVQYFQDADGMWHDSTIGGDSGWQPVGSARYRARQSGRYFRFRPEGNRRTALLRGKVSYEWRLKGRVVRHAERLTTGGHNSAAGSYPPGYSQASCTMTRLAGKGV